MNDETRRLSLRELLAGPLPKLLPTAEKQRAFIWRQNAVKVACPNCVNPVNVIEAGRFKLDEPPPDRTSDEYYVCPQCNRQLVFVVPFFPVGGAWYVWQLVPEKVEPRE